VPVNQLFQLIGLPVAEPAAPHKGCDKLWQRTAEGILDETAALTCLKHILPETYNVLLRRC
jgi:hypothetical protein